MIELFRVPLAAVNLKTVNDFVYELVRSLICAELLADQFCLNQSRLKQQLDEGKPLILRMDAYQLVIRLTLEQMWRVRGEVDGKKEVFLQSYQCLRIQVTDQVGTVWDRFQLEFGSETGQIMSMSGKTYDESAPIKITLGKVDVEEMTRREVNEIVLLT